MALENVEVTYTPEEFTELYNSLRGMRVTLEATVIMMEEDDSSIGDYKDRLSKVDALISKMSGQMYWFHLDSAADDLLQEEGNDHETR